MAYTVTELITGAYYASGVVSRDFESVSGSQINDGLLWANDILQEKTVDFGMVPYETTATVIAVPGQEAYFIENLIQIDTLTFSKNNVRYSMQYQKRNRYFGDARTNDILTLPYSWYFERGFGGGTLYIYFEPDQAYPLEIHGIYRLESVSLNQDLELTLDRFYITWLRYALADRICAEFALDTPPKLLTTLRKYESWIDKKSRVLDLRMQKQTTLSRDSYLNYGQVNLGKGFTVG